MRSKPRKNIERQAPRIKNGQVRNLFFAMFVIFGCCLSSQNLTAQCAMCRAAIESEGDVKKQEAVNDGIVYLMAIPYVLVGAIGFAIYRMYSKKEK